MHVAGRQERDRMHRALGREMGGAEKLLGWDANVYAAEEREIDRGVG